MIRAAGAAQLTTKSGTSSTTPAAGTAFNPVTPVRYLEFDSEPEVPDVL